MNKEFDEKIKFLALEIFSEGVHISIEYRQTPLNNCIFQCKFRMYICMYILYVVLGENCGKHLRNYKFIYCCEEYNKNKLPNKISVCKHIKYVHMYVVMYILTYVCAYLAKRRFVHTHRF